MSDPKQGVNYQELVFIDVETSGLDSKQHEIIQVAAKHMPSGDELNLLLKFDESKASPEALKINHYEKLTWDQCGISQKEGIFQLGQFLSSHGSLSKQAKSGRFYFVAALCGYNIQAFDRFFLIDSFNREKVFFPGDYRMYDIYALALWMMPGLEAYNLESIRKTLDLPVRQAHDAIGDVHMTLDIFCTLMKDDPDSQIFDVPEWVTKRLREIKATKKHQELNGFELPF